MLPGEDETREQLVSELAGLRQRVAELEAAEGERKRADEELAGQRDHLEKLVGERTAELKALNWHLKQQITERERAEALHSFMDSAVDGFLLFDSELNWIDMNNRASEILGVKREEVIGKNIVEAVPDVEKTGRYDKYREVLKTGKSMSFDDVVPHPKFQKVHLAVKAFKVGDGLGIIGTDITERKLAEQALKVEKNKLQSVIDAIEYSLTIMDKDYNIIYQSQPLITTGDYSLGEKCYRVFEGRETVCDGCPIEKVFEDGKSHTAERRIVLPSGEVQFLENTASPVRDAEGKIVSCLEITRDVTERKRAEEKRQTILNTALDGFWLVNLEGRIIEVNDSYCKMVGYTREELLEMSIPDLEAVESPEDVAKRIKKIIEQGYDSFESRHRCKDGQIIGVEISVNYLDVGEGQFFVFARDITERQRAEEALQAERNKLQSVIDALEYGLTIQDRDYNILYQTGQLKKYFGDYLGDKCYRAYESRDTICHGCPVEKAFRDGKSHSAEKDGTTPSGEVFIMERTASPIRDAEGKIVSCLEITRDVTERKRAEEAIKESEEKYRELAESITDVFFAFDKDLRYTYWNKASEELTGISAEDALGKNLYEVFPDNEMTRSAEKVYLKALSTQQAQSFVSEFQLGGKNYFFEINAYPSKGGLSVFVKDITERKRAEEALQAEKNKLQSVIDSIEYGLSIQDRDYNILYQSQPMVKAAGDHLGEKCYRAYEARDTVCDGCPVEQAFKDGELHTSERKVVTASGRVVFLEHTACPVKDAAGRIVSCVEIPRNVTERKRAEEKRQTILKTALDGFYLANMEGKFLEVNDSYCEMLGYTREELLAMSILDIEAIESPEEVAQHVKKGAAQGYDRFETRQKRKDGQIIDVEISGNYLDTGEGQFFVFVRDITERKRAEEKLRDATQKWTSLVEHTNDIIIIVDNKGAIQYINRTIPPITIDQVIGKKFYDFTAPEYRGVAREALAKVFATGEQASFESSVKHPSGVLWFETTMIPITEDGKVISAMSFNTNITERKRAEEALRESEEKFRRIFENVSEVIIRVDRYGKILDVNARSEECFGYKPEEVIGKNFAKIGVLSLKDLPKMVKLFGEVIRGRRAPSMVELEVKRKDGNPAFVEVNPTIVKKNGKAEGFVTIVRDITERKQAEEAVRESEEKLRKMFESVTDGISVVDLDGIITGVNQKTVEMHGFGSRDEIVGKSAFELVAPADHKRVAANMRKALKGGIMEGVEYTLHRADGSEFPAELGTSVLKDASGKAIGHITISRDITERKEAEEREEELQHELYLASRLAAVGELAAGVAHEMNNPLTGIMGFSERLLRKSGDDDAKKDVEIIHSEAQRLAKVVKNLLTFARQREPAKEFADINEIVQKTLELRAYELKSSNIEVALDLAANLPQIMVDFHQIQEVFLNIILNAEQAMTAASDGGKLTIKTRPIKDYVRISFADDGPGISAEHLDRVFNPFFTTKGERGGTGLGLSVCHGIVTEHDGRIYARSRPGSGATFLVDLPLTSRKISESQIAPEKLSV